MQTKCFTRTGVPEYYALLPATEPWGALVDVFVQQFELAERSGCWSRLVILGLPARQPSVAEKSHLAGKATTFFSTFAVEKGRFFQSEAEAKGVAFVKEKGTVKWFNGAKGYGFIQRSTGEDVFVHFSAIQENGYRTLNEGETVEYELMKGPKGFLAANVLRGSAN